MAKSWLDSLGLQPKPPAGSAAADLFDNPFMQSVRGAWGLDKPGSGQAQPMANPFADNPFTKAFQEMLSGNFGQPGTGKPAANPYADEIGRASCRARGGQY